MIVLVAALSFPAAVSADGFIQVASVPWNGSSYVSGFTHTDDVQGFTVLRVRPSPQRDIAETGTSDLRVRDSPTGAVLWRASASVPNWIGAQPYFMPSDLDGDGVHELVVVDRGTQYPSALASTDVFRFSNGSWVRLWGRQGWEPQGLLNTDSDPQAELVMQDTSSLNGQKAIVDGLTGATELALPATDISHNLDAFDGDGDGRTEIYLHRQAPLVPRVRVERSGLHTALLAHRPDAPVGVGTSSQHGPERDLRVHANGSPDPLALRVFPSAPNAFRDATTLSFELPSAGEADVRIYDAAGRLVRRLDRTFPAGRNTLRWDGLDDVGRPVPSGVLFYDVVADGMKQTRKLVRLQ